MNFEAGRELLHYRLIEKIGEGGMGVVWKAVDTTLDREVAIKVLPESLAGQADRLARFEREAKLLASLNHPNIASIHSVHELEGTRFLTMELVDGEDLAERLARGALPVEQALDIAVKVAEALEAAHQRGIVHRDLKPANVRLTSDGGVKVLDFGLARAFDADPDSNSASPTMSPTLTSAGTVAGVILGTAAYMSPEQARGHTVDSRADVWAFGVLLYEMLTGGKAFEGGTISDTLADVLRAEPRWESLPPATHRRIRRLLTRCLQKERKQRLHHIADARLEIVEVLAGGAEPEEPAAAAAQPRSAAAMLPWLLTLLFAVLAAFAWLRPDQAPEAAAMLELAVPIPAGLELIQDQNGGMALSRDGRFLVVVMSDGSEQHLYLKRLDRAGLERLEATAGAHTPFFSPDGEWIGFFADDAMKKISVNGGDPLSLCSSSSVKRGASWTDDNRIVFTPNFGSALMVVSGAGGEPQPLTTLDEEKHERTHRWPHAIAGTDIVLFTVGTSDSPEFYDNATIDAVRVRTGERRTVFEGASLAHYLPTGHLLIARQGFLLAAPFDLEALELRGEPVPVIERVAGNRRSGVVHAATSAHGLLAYVSGGYLANDRTLAWIDRATGNDEVLRIPEAGYIHTALSPDGKRLAIARAGETDYDIWTLELDRNLLARLTFEGGSTSPVWSHDGSRIFFYGVREEHAAVYVVPADGSAAAELLHAREDRITAPTSASHDGRHLMINVVSDEAADLEVLDLASGETTPFVESPHQDRKAVFSPDDLWVAYQSNESGRVEVYVRPFPGPGGKWQVSTNGGREPHWSADGREIIYRTARELFVVEVETGDRIRITQPQKIYDRMMLIGPLENSYSVTADGQRIIQLKAAAGEEGGSRIHVIVNWFDELNRRMPLD